MSNHPKMSEPADEHGMNLHYGRKEKVPEHIHDWHLAGGINDCFAICDCDEKMEADELIRRLNATESLSAEDARMASKAIQKIIEWAVPQLTDKRPNITHSELEDYASALEGEVAPR